VRLVTAFVCFPSVARFSEKRELRRASWDFAREAGGSGTTGWSRSGDRRGHRRVCNSLTQVQGWERGFKRFQERLWL
jgi:hypothetical protein